MARRKSTHKYVPIDVRIPPEVRDAVEAAAKARVFVGLYAGS
jgi:hypothetical protein